jgi:nitronate monooxygenase
MLDNLAAGKSVRHKLDTKGSPTEEPAFVFDPVEYGKGVLPPVKRPAFLAIVSSHVLATMLARKVEPSVDGFIVEAPTAGGHNAPPRGKLALNDIGEPVYGERDEPDFAAIRDLGLPFWLAGSRAEPEAIQEALDLGATGVQVGTAFAFCEESGFEADLKHQVVQMSRRGEAHIFTDPVASPTGFPFKVIQMEGTLSEQPEYEARQRVCDLGYLRSAYAKEDGSIGWRCAAEPVQDFVDKGGDIADTVGRKCLCNALMANIGLGQTQRSGAREGVLLTSGDDVAGVARFLPEGSDTYTAQDVIDYLLNGVEVG